MLLTGCASGIGKYLASQLLARGHRVCCTDIDCDAVDSWLEVTDCDVDCALSRPLDVRDSDAWRETIEAASEKFGGLDVVMNIAGFLRPGYVNDVSESDIDMHFDVNAKGVILGTREAARVMVEQGGGHIINIGSLASLTPVPGLSLYGASKFAVRGFSLAAAEELRPEGVAVSVVLLDAVKTPMLDLQADYEEAALTFSGSRPLTLEEVETLIVDEVLPKRPLEVTLPKSRGMMARFAGLAPEMTRLLAPILTRLGKRAQATYENSSE